MFKENSTFLDLFLNQSRQRTYSCPAGFGSILAIAENAIQNNILEELETFPGIFIATTNLLENIDTAFYRRFAYKILLPLPDYECRLQLWKLHLPETIPGAKYIDIDYLAEHYILTGGQIKLIIANACSYAITRQITNKHISQLDIEKFIVNETLDYADKDTRVIGFSIL